MRKAVCLIESISEWSGRLLYWLPLILALVLFYEVVMIYAFNAPTIWAHVTSMMLGVAIFSGGLAYTTLYHSHIRVDVLYQSFSPKGKLIADIVFFFLCSAPFALAVIYGSAERMLFAWQINEVMTESYWYPPAAPIRTVFFAGFCLFALQITAQFIRDLYQLRGKVL